MKKSTIILAIIGSFVVFVIVFAVWRYFATISGSRKTTEGLLKRIEPVIADLESNRQPKVTEIESLAADATTRNIFYSALKHIGRSDLFPAQYRTLEAIGESDLVVWLLHPNELNAKPDEIEAVKTIEKIEDGNKCRFVVYRFRTHPPHWASKDGWLAGIAGPYFEGEDRSLSGRSLQ
jgi:hypothetical protein